MLSVTTNNIRCHYLSCRQKGMMPGVAFIGGKLSVIGGYSWPGGVKLIETWNDITDEWDRSNVTLKYPR